MSHGDGPTVVVSDERDPDDSPDVTIDLSRWERLATAVLFEEEATGELTLTFVDVADIVELNDQHMGQAGPTDVLSFPMDDDATDGAIDGAMDGVPRLLGDIVISPAVAAGQFADHAGTLDDELALLVTHGILHVLGHDHAEPGETAVMRRRELELLQRHHWDGPAPEDFRQAQD